MTNRQRMGLKICLYYMHKEMRMRLFTYLLLSCLLTAITATAGKKLRVLFIGNSYTSVNNLPQILANIANASGDTVIWEMETPGGMTLKEHFESNPATISKIMKGGWDYVVLQDQSQTPALPNDFVATGFFPFVRKLDSVIDKYNPCAQTIMYMTWGRKFSDNQLCQQYTINFNWPHYCSYTAMDSVLHLRYMMAADSIKAAVSPVGAVWRYIRKNHAGIELYDTDESHPSPAGSYAGALSFYTSMFRKDPTLTSTYNYTLNTTDATNIRTAAKKVAFDSMLHWHIGQYELASDFTYSNAGPFFTFTNKSVNATSYNWYFGDGNTSALQNPIHSYTVMGDKTVMLVATNATTNCKDTSYGKVFVPTSVESANHAKVAIDIYPNPTTGLLYISNRTNEKIKSIQVYSMQGKLVQTYSNPSGVIDMRHLSSATYMVRVQTASGLSYYHTINML
ncbi:hypothetical protein CAP35_10350 [Chitinophagaceae bacterium IBVUCB1]|nr:hypothetical protein CAP35_10350 [Chitinophagaceae bacterium IBVUCB1]